MIILGLQYHDSIADVKDAVEVVQRLCALNLGNNPGNRMAWSEFIHQRCRIVSNVGYICWFANKRCCHVVYIILDSPPGTNNIVGLHFNCGVMSLKCYMIRIFYKPEVYFVFFTHCWNIQRNSGDVNPLSYITQHLNNNETKQGRLNIFHTNLSCFQECLCFEWHKPLLPTL